MIKFNGKNDNFERCGWSLASQQLLDYHDHEWGVAVHDDQLLFEKLCLETFQAGLSWRTILAKRQNFRDAFVQFDFTRVAQFRQKQVDALLHNAGIVRNRRKIEAVINNAARAVELVEKAGSLDNFFWNLYDYSPAGAKKLSQALKKQGWQFIGPTTLYSFFEAAGMVNGHEQQCFVHSRPDINR